MFSDCWGIQLAVVSIDPLSEWSESKEQLLQYNIYNYNNILHKYKNNMKPATIITIKSNIIKWKIL